MPPLLIDQHGNPLVPIERAPVGPIAPPPGGWFPVVREPFAGAWQRNIEVRADTILSHVAVFRCISLISGDIAKMRPRLIQEVSSGVWEETTSPAFSPVLAQPNHYQNRIQFIEAWLISKLAAGNTYALKERDARGLVTALYLLDPRRVRPLVADNGDVFYQLYSDNLAGVVEQTTVPASEIIHDRWNCLFHPLCGLSPIFANGLAATQGLRIQEHSTLFFMNSANPGGILTAPGKISDDTAARLEAAWSERTSGANAGRMAVAGDGLKYEAVGVNALNSQLIEQLKWTAEMVAASYGVPAYKVGVGVPPATTNVEALGQQYYTDCLQIHIEALELCLDEGLRLPAHYGVEFDLDGLVRMDSETKMRTLAEGVNRGILKPNEARAKTGYRPVAGGDTPYMQEQNWPLKLLADRELPSARPPTPPAPVTPPANEGGDANQTNALTELFYRRAAAFA